MRQRRARDADDVAPATRTNAPQHAPNAPRTPFLLLVLGLVVGGLCALLALNTASAANELQRHGYATADESVANQVAVLDNAVAASAAPANIAAAAALLGMVPAGNPAFFVVRPDGAIVLMGVPAAATGFPIYVAPTQTSSTKRPATASTTPSVSKTPSTSTKPSPSRGSSSAARTSPTSGSRSRSAPAAAPTPTPTPTPNSTLPGGDR